jgi:hypothetical protein
MMRMMRGKEARSEEKGGGGKEKGKEEGERS